MKPHKVVGAVSFLNAKPLVVPLERGDIDHSFRVTTDVPSRCADRLLSGETDVALIPSIEYARHPDSYEIVPDVCIASDGPVASVLLFSKVPFGAIGTLALDASSRTSATLVQILLHKHYHVAPEMLIVAPDADLMLSLADAGLLIGDAALDRDRYSEVKVLDLGQLWKEMTGFPFVYAFWACHRGLLNTEDVDALISAKEQGKKLLDTIADEHAKTHPKSPVFYRSYLRENVRYDLGQKEIEGMLTFYRFAHRLGLTNQVPELRFLSKL